MIRRFRRGDISSLAKCRTTFRHARSFSPGSKQSLGREPRTWFDKPVSEVPAEGDVPAYQGPRLPAPELTRLAQPNPVS
jgi:hypothetical protein